MARSNFANAQLLGNLTADPVVTFTPKGKAVAELTIAVNSSYKNSSGKLVEEVSFIDVDVWEAQAENAKKYLRKGSYVQVHGIIRQHKWEDKEGKKHSKLKVTAEKVIYMDPPPKKGEDSPEASE